MKYKMGVVGLGVMGANLARNIESRGFPVIGHDTDATKAELFLKAAAGKEVGAEAKPQAFISAIERPRRVLVMVPAGESSRWSRRKSAAAASPTC